MPISLEEAASRYLAGENVGAIAAAFGRSQGNLRKHLRRAGVPIRPPGARRLHPRELRQCPRCGRMFETVLAPGREPRPKNHCRKYPPPTPRPCEQCGRLFAPDPEKLARGAGRFCTYTCWNAWRTGRAQAEWRHSLSKLKR